MRGGCRDRWWISAGSRPASTPQSNDTAHSEERSDAVDVDGIHARQIGAHMHEPLQSAVGERHAHALRRPTRAAGSR